MAHIVVENLILSAHLNQSLDLEKIKKTFSEASFVPEELPAIVFHYQNPSRVVFITEQGKMICTGSKTTDEAIKTLIETENHLKEKNLIKEATEISPEVEYIVVSKQWDTTFPLSRIQSNLPPEDCIYNPDKNPWLEYHQPSYTMLFFPSGNIICTGKLSLDETKDAFKNIENTLTSIGCEITE